jgi:hypothetical protein
METTADICIDGAQFWISDINVIAELDRSVYRGGGNGLIAVRPGYVVILGGMVFGYARVTIDERSGAPEVNVDEWDDVVEVSVTFATDHVRASGPMGSYPELGSIVPGPGDYRMRVHVRGRDAARPIQGVAGEPGSPAEEYLIAVWPEPPGAEQRLKLTEEVGQEHRNRP